MISKTSYENYSFNFEEKNWFGDVDLAGKLNYADLCQSSFNAFFLQEIYNDFISMNKNRQ